MCTTLEPNSSRHDGRELRLYGWRRHDRTAAQTSACYFFAFLTSEVLCTENSSRRSNHRSWVPFRRFEASVKATRSVEREELDLHDDDAPWVSRQKQHSLASAISLFAKFSSCELPQDGNEAQRPPLSWSRANFRWSSSRTQKTTSRLDSQNCRNVATRGLLRKRTILKERMLKLGLISNFLLNIISHGTF